MDKRLFICAAVIAVLVVFAFWAYKNLEPYTYKTRINPSREARINRYLALERWLAETGRPVRVENRISAAKIAAGPEKVVVVDAPACGWEQAAEILTPWIEAGGFLTVSVREDFEDEALAELFLTFGIDWEAGSGEAEDNDTPLLVRVFRGSGALAVTRSLRFMSSNNLGDEENARLSWDLTGARAGGENPGVLFIHEKRVTQGFFGKIVERGNFFPLAASAILVIILGFWMVIPGFGPVFAEKTAGSRPIRERFRAEIAFLKKYDSLRYYVDVYRRELKLAEDDRPAGYRDIIRRLKELEAITERI
jgi:hypothetical protein